MTLTCQYEVFKIRAISDRQFAQGRSRIRKWAQEGGDTSAPNCHSKADFHVCLDRILASARAKLE